MSEERRKVNFDISGNALPTRGRVSVLVTAKDAERTIKATIQSILFSMRAADEVLVLADGCSDSTEVVARKFRDARVRVFSAEKSLGRGEGRNFLARQAKGDILAVNDADDLCLPWRIRLSARAISEYPVIFGTAVILFEKFRFPLLIPQVPHGLEGEAVFRNLILRNPFVHSTMMIRKDLFLDVGGYRMDEGEDYDLYLRLANLGVPFRRFAMPLILYRVHTDQATAISGFESRVERNPRIVRQIFDLAKLLYPNQSTEQAKSKARSSCVGSGFLSRLDFLGYQGFLNHLQENCLIRFRNRSASHGPKLR